MTSGHRQLLSRADTRRPVTALALCALVLLAPRIAAAEAISLISNGFFRAALQPPAPDAQTRTAQQIAAEVARDLLATRRAGPAPKVQPGQTAAPDTASLFSGNSGTSLFAPTAPRPPRQSGPRQSGPASHPAAFTPTPFGLGATDRLKHLIASAESRRDGYDAVQYAAKVRPPKPPTRLTIADIFAWIAATPGQQHAIGRYQIIPSTLRYLTDTLGISPDQLFSPALQDRLADQLLADAGYGDFLSGLLPRHAFMDNLARIWAGLPNGTGKSHYDGIAGNRAAFSWDSFDREMARIFPG